VKSLGMADRVNTLEATIQRLQGTSYRRHHRADSERRRLALVWRSGPVLRPCRVMRLYFVAVKRKLPSEASSL
jgi:hypothetical protein